MSQPQTPARPLVRRRVRRRARPDQRELDRRRLRRDLGRAELVATAVAQLVEAGDPVDHERVAAVTGLPVGYLRWAHPDPAGPLRPGTGGSEHPDGVTAPKPDAGSQSGAGSASPRGGGVLAAAARCDPPDTRNPAFSRATPA